MSKGTRGRMPTSFVESSERSKRRKIQNVRASNDDNLLCAAVPTILRSRGNTSAAVLVNEVINTSPNGAKTIASSLKTTSDYQKYTSDEALSLIISNNLTKR